MVGTLPTQPLLLHHTNLWCSDIDKSRSARPTGARLGGSLFGASSSSVPSELQPLVQPQTSLSRAETAARPLLATANTDYGKMTDPATPVPTPPVHAARLSSLLKNLASAEGAVNDSMKARRDLIAGLDKLLQTNRAKLSEEEENKDYLSARRATTEAKKKEVEDGIMRGLSAETFNAPLHGYTNGSRANSADTTSPQVESFTPPPPDMETFTPTASPTAVEPEPSYPADERGYGQDFLETDTYLADPVQEQHPTYNEPPPSFAAPPSMQTAQTAFPSGADSLLRSLALPQPTPTPQPHPVNTAPMDPRLKRRKMSHKPDDDEPFAGNDGVGIDSDVAAMLGAQ